jgi:exonuclease VII large subunit
MTESIIERLSNRLTRTTRQVTAILDGDQAEQRILEKETRTMTEIVRALIELGQAANTTMLAIERGVIGRKESDEQLESTLHELSQATALARNYATVFLVSDVPTILEVFEAVDLAVAKDALKKFRRIEPKKFEGLLEVMLELYQSED